MWEPDNSVDVLAREFGCSSLVASLLWMNGVSSGAAASERKNRIMPDLTHWLDAVDLGADSPKACDLWSRVGEGSKVLVYGDYDVDGIAATTFMMELALLKRASVRYYIPHRYNQGYGFHPGVVQNLIKSDLKCDLLVVVDCGTNNADAAQVARACGIPVMIFDHHLARGGFAECDSLINPQIDGNDLARNLCAAGVVWCWAWKNEIAPREWLLKNLDVAALATVADCVPMSSPLNRAIVREGINSMRANPRKGLKALMHAMDVDLEALDTDSLAMRIIPCLNAAGRLELADSAMKVFFPCKDVEQHVQKLVNLNRKRRDISAKIIDDIEKGTGGNSDYKYVLFGDDWPAGVLSSVASHICAKRETPVVLAAPAHKSIVRGTLRVPPGVDAEAILDVLSGELASWGGHRMAAGFSVNSRQWSSVRDKLEELLSEAEIIEEKDNILYWSPAELDMSTWKDAARLGPFGVGNPYPTFFCSHRGNICAEPLGSKGNHVKIFVDGRTLLGFSGEHLLNSDISPLGWIYKPRINFWRSTENLQLVLEKIVLGAA